MLNKTRNAAGAAAFWSVRLVGRCTPKPPGTIVYDHFLRPLSLWKNPMTFVQIIKTWDSIQKQSTQKLRFVVNRTVMGEREYV